MEWRALQDVPEDEREELLRTARRRRFEREEVVFHEDDPADCVHLVVRGRFAVRRHAPLGSMVMLAVRGPGQAFGELALFGGPRRRAARVSALEEGETRAVYREDFDRLRRRRPAVGEALLGLLAEDLRRTNELLLEAYWVPADRRVRRRLLELVHIFEGEVSLRQEDLAELAGTSRATVNRVLRAEEARGAVQLSRGKVSVVDEPGVARRAGLQPR